MPVTCDEGEQGYVIRLQGDVDISCSAELKATLLEALASPKAVRVDLGQATDFDVTAVQLLWAAAREAAQRGEPLSFAGDSGMLARAAQEIGLEFAQRGVAAIASIEGAAGAAERAG